MHQNNIESVLKQHQLIPVVTIHNEQEVDKIVSSLLAKNIHCIEVTLRTEASLKAIEIIREKYASEMTLGVGTVIQKRQVDLLKSIGVDFIVNPGINEGLGKHIMDSEIPFIPGVCTPSEIITGLENGWDILKFFPANLFGGIKALKTYGQVFPQVKFCPTGGINQETYQDYLDLPNVISVGGSWMVK